MTYKTREEQIRAELTLEKVINLIRNVYHAQYDPTKLNFDAWDQLLACETIEKTTPKEEEITKDSVSVSGNGSDSGKLSDKSESTQGKREAIAELRTCTYKTPPREVALLLEKLFSSHKSKPGHWLYIAQHYTPRAINRTINRMMKRHNSGHESILNTSAYFTYTIQFRKKRKIHL